MKRLLPLLPLLLAALLGFGCDRFDHSFGPDGGDDLQEELFSPLQSAFDAVPASGLDPVLDFYVDDYLHFGLTKTDRRTWLEGIYNTDPGAHAAVTLLDAQQLSDSTAVVNWNLRITSAARTVFADSTFIGERLALRDGHWLLKGNQMACPPPTPKQRVIIEYFTFLGCPNCPVVEAELHDLQLLYPNQLSYLEHHTSGPLLVPGDGTFNYYGPFTVPTSIFQGQTKLTGSTADIVEAYAPLVQNLVNLDSVVKYNNLNYTVSGQTVTGSVMLEQLSSSFSQTDLVLNYVLIERVSSYNNTQGESLRNVVRAKGSLDISSADLDLPIQFNLESPNPIPDDASLVVFAQTKPSPFANNAVIHSGIEVPLSKAAYAKK